jgi:hypothetical protein
MVIPVRVDGANARINVIGEADARINGLPVAQKRGWLTAVLSKENVSWFVGLVSALSLFTGIRVIPRGTRGRRF